MIVDFAASLLSLSSYETVYIVGFLTVGALLVVTAWPNITNKASTFPVINEKPPLEILSINTKRRFHSGAQNLIALGLTKYRNSPFYLNTDIGRLAILPATQNAEHIRSHPGLSFGKFVTHDLFGTYPGFEPFREGTSNEGVFVDSIRMKLTQSLGRIARPVSEETTFALQQHWTDNPDWHEIHLLPAIIKTVAQLSSRVFVGEELCRDPTWLRVTTSYTVDTFIASRVLHLWPTFLRPIVHWFLPSCRKLRTHIKQARNVITPIFEKRKQARDALIKQGETPETASSDVMDWLEDVAKGRPYDPAIVQLTYSFVAIHTTTDLVTQALFDLCQHPELIPELRQEIISVIGKDGWTKSAAHKLKLMDSVLKESQRLKPVAMTAMRRYAKEKIRLPDNTEIPKNSFLMVPLHHMWNDASIYPDPHTFDGRRFLKLRQQPGLENVSQLVSTSTNHLGFGHGKHACPGRFFASFEVKIALCHMLLKYDMKLVDGCRPKVMPTGFALQSDPEARIMIRRRQEEVSL